MATAKSVSAWCNCNQKDPSQYHPAHAGKSCQPGCACKRHIRRICEPGCVCKRHVQSLEHIAKVAALRVGTHHSAETRTKMSKSAKALTRTPEHKANLSRGRIRHQSDCDGSCGSHWCKPNGYGQTQCERDLLSLLAEFPNVHDEVTFGRYRVDAYLPDYHVAFEADGTYWHGNPESQARDAKRDAYLLDEFNLPVVRLTQDELSAMSWQQ